MKHKVINMERSTLIILAAVCIILFIAPLVMYSGLGEDEGYFGGSDDAASEQIEASNYEPWSGEIESLLFALQAAIGAIIIGYFFGYWRGQGKEE